MALGVFFVLVNNNFIDKFPPVPQLGGGVGVDVFELTYPASIDNPAFLILANNSNIGYPV